VYIVDVFPRDVLSPILSSVLMMCVYYGSESVHAGGIQTGLCCLCVFFLKEKLGWGVREAQPFDGFIAPMVIPSGHRQARPS
jgi:hypothetical protein